MSPAAQHDARTRSAALATAALAAWIAVLCRTAPTAPGAHDAWAETPDVPPVDATCSASGEPAAQRARAAEAHALGAIERYPFDASEGMRALAYLAEAAECFRIASDGAHAAQVATRTRTWRARIDRDYRDHLLRYRLAVAARRDARALAEVEALLALLPQHDDAFVSQLRRTRDALAAAGAHATGEP